MNPNFPTPRSAVHPGGIGADAVRLKALYTDTAAAPMTPTEQTAMAKPAKPEVPPWAKELFKDLWGAVNDLRSAHNANADSIVHAQHLIALLAERNQEVRNTIVGVLDPGIRQTQDRVTTLEQLALPEPQRSTALAALTERLLKPARKALGVALGKKVNDALKAFDTNAALAGLDTGEEVF